MKGNFVILQVFLVFLLSSCHRADDSLVGRWTVEKVNVEFDENHATPEMVRQYGEMEKGNVIEIGKDSLLTFISEGDTLRGKCSLRGAQLFLDGYPFGCFENTRIETRTATPLGEIVVIYKR